MKARPFITAYILLPLLFCACLTSCGPDLNTEVPDPDENVELAPEPEEILKVNLEASYLTFKDGDESLAMHFTVETSNADSLSVKMEGEKGLVSMEMSLSEDRLSGDLLFTRLSKDLFSEYINLVFSNGRKTFTRTFSVAYSAFLWDDGSAVREIGACGLANSLTLSLQKNYQYTVECKEEWIKVTETTGSSITFELSEHNAYEGREGDIVLVNKADGMKLTCHVTQDHTDKLALLAFYKALDGPNWVKEENWSESIPFSQFSRVGQRDGRVTSLKLRDYHLKGELPEEFFTLDKLETLNLGCSRWEATSDVVFGADYTDLWNDVRGVFRASCFPHLKKLYLQGNMQLAGNIEEMWETSLEDINLTNCSFTGTLSDGISKLTGLTSLQVADNKLSGTISNEITKIDNLKYIDIGNGLHYPDNLWNRPEWRGERRNEFDGGIPEDLGKMKSLQQFRAEWVCLSGEIPQSVFTSGTIKVFNVSFNELNGILESNWFKGMSALNSFSINGNSNLFIKGEKPTNVHCTNSQIIQ